ncbi:hypothetical protein DM01DRAFT_1405549 [Hesseltinella vesiculosa]|uniref:RA-domain-containing protein n=1 Tax=Hesseltinella vesiculosa TaxID=101127 RepID=A0A1X2GQC1_9FUNG|nr:hypothetical protein DM01DRAFT_1405549 [Hesseltinella vesiculosa]
MDNVLLWDTSKVGKWIASIGYSCFETQFKEQGITGDVLMNLDHDTLKDLSVHSVGQRMDVLKHIYVLKTSQRLPVNEWDYIPPSALYENDYLGPNGMADYRKIEVAFQDRDNHLRKLTDELERITMEMNKMREDMVQFWKFAKDKKPLPSFDIDKKHTHSSSNVKPLHILTPPSASHAPDYFHSEKSYSGNDDNKPNVMINDGGAIKVYGEKINNSKVDLEASKNVRLLLDDPCSKVILSALKKYNVVDDWRQYTLWIQFGANDNIQERQLGYDEKPLRISQKLKEAKLNPVYVLKHVKDNKPFIPSEHQRTIVPKPSLENAAKTATITSGRIAYDVVAPVMSSSISSPTPSSTLISRTPTGPYPFTPPPLSHNDTKDSTTNANASNEFLNDLGLDSGVAKAIYSIMMEQDKPM